jgi:hypothetical protein
VLQALEDVVSKLNDMGIAVFEEAPDAEVLFIMSGRYGATIGELLDDDEETEFNEDLPGSPPY